MDGQSPNKLQTGGFKWLAQEKTDKMQIQELVQDSSKGLILEVDFEYPSELHGLHNDYPVAAEQMKATKDMLSPYCRALLEKYQASIGQLNKIVPTLADKEQYVLHYRNLQLYLNLGLKIHRALEFNQSPYLKWYISYNTEKG